MFVSRERTQCPRIRGAGLFPGQSTIGQDSPRYFAMSIRKRDLELKPLGPEHRRRCEGSSKQVGTSAGRRPLCAEVDGFAGIELAVNPKHRGPDIATLHGTSNATERCLARRGMSEKNLTV